MKKGQYRLAGLGGRIIISMGAPIWLTWLDGRHLALVHKHRCNGWAVSDFATGYGMKTSILHGTSYREAIKAARLLASEHDWEIIVGWAKGELLRSGFHYPLNKRVKR